MLSWTTTDDADRLSTVTDGGFDFLVTRGEDLVVAVFGSLLGLVFRWLAAGADENKGCCLAAIIVAGQASGGDAAIGNKSAPQRRRDNLGTCLNTFAIDEALGPVLQKMRRCRIPEEETRKEKRKSI